jgi:BirA family biotin operon repressor/biotin-[acetyl-CoA-carboxylase] ligase
VVVGVGLNLLAPQDAQALIGQPASGLFDGAAPIRVEALVSRVVLAVAKAWTTHEREGLAPFLPLWARFDAWHGKQVVVNEAGQTLARGQSLGIAPSGALRLLTDEGERQIVAGDLSLRAERQA